MKGDRLFNMSTKSGSGSGVVMPESWNAEPWNRLPLHMARPVRVILKELVPLSLTYGTSP